MTDSNGAAALVGMVAHPGVPGVVVVATVAGMLISSAITATMPGVVVGGAIVDTVPGVVVVATVPGMLISSTTLTPMAGMLISGAIVDTVPGMLISSAIVATVPGMLISGAITATMAGMLISGAIVATMAGMLFSGAIVATMAGMLISSAVTAMATVSTAMTAVATAAVIVTGDVAVPTSMSSMGTIHTAMSSMATIQVGVPSMVAIHIVTSMATVGIMATMCGHRCHVMAAVIVAPSVTLSANTTVTLVTAAVLLVKGMVTVIVAAVTRTAMRRFTILPLVTGSMYCRGTADVRPEGFPGSECACGQHKNTECRSCEFLSCNHLIRLSVGCHPTANRPECPARMVVTPWSVPAARENTYVWKTFLVHAKRSDAEPVQRTTGQHFASAAAFFAAPTNNEGCVRRT